MKLKWQGAGHGPWREAEMERRMEDEVIVTEKPWIDGQGRQRVERTFTHLSDKSRMEAMQGLADALKGFTDAGIARLTLRHFDEARAALAQAAPFLEAK